MVSVKEGRVEGRGRDESIRTEHVGGGGAGETGRGEACWWVGEARSPLRQEGQFQPMVEQAAQILRKLARVREEQEKFTHLEQVKHFSEYTYLPRESTWSRGNVGGPEVDAIDKSQVVVGEPWGRGWSGCRRCNGGTGLSGGSSLTLEAALRAKPTHCSASCTDCAKVSTGKGGAEEVHLIEASRTLKGVSAQFEVTDGAGVPEARMVTDWARVRMDIATNKEQSKDKETSKKGPVN